MKKIVMKLLAFFANKIIKKYKPKVVGITGSVGKTSSKEAISLVLSCQKRVRSSFSNYNNEFGLPLTIIGLKSPGKNLFKWFFVFCKAIFLLFFKDKSYPEYLVLEMGIDREGDMDYLLKIVKPDRAVLTNISHSHLEYFGSIDKIKKEKMKLLHGLKKGGVAIVNSDNDFLKNVKEELKVLLINYGFKPGANILARDLNFILPDGDLKNNFYGANFKLEYRGSIVPVVLPGVISKSSVYSVLSALAVAISFDFNLIDLVGCLKNIKVPVGRMNVLSGIKNTILIDDTYNSSPESSLLALDFLQSIKKRQNRRKIVALGDMLELGNYSEEGHRLIGDKISKLDIDEIVLVGEKSRDIGRGAIAGGFDKNFIFQFKESSEAGLFLQKRMSEGDVVLLKGSQGVRMEKAVKEIMAEPMKSGELLVRQSNEWVDK
jgi:UDP-N-acetylmuramoyl-tripeptide--D-alanyl-D-alanine ligase